LIDDVFIYRYFAPLGLILNHYLNHYRLKGGRLRCGGLNRRLKDNGLLKAGGFDQIRLTAD
jgi:hypothetical protein